MAESFEVRVKRLFGSKLFETVPENSFPASSWSVADGEVEKREWNRERGDGPDREDDPCSSAFSDRGCFFKKPKTSRDRQKEFEGDLDDLDDDEEGGGEEDLGDDEEREEKEIRSSVGLDPTLDYEDEEDEHDKAALCRENAGERLYMRDVKDHGPHLNYHSIVPDFLEEPSDKNSHFQRGSQADHLAASVRLDNETAETCPALPTNRNEVPPRDLPVKITEDDVNLKPILKRKETQTDSKPKKRVRFDPGCKNDHDDEVYEEPQDFPMVPTTMETTGVSEEPSLGVPDYVRNPSKYTRYTFDSSENDDDEMNKQGFEEFRNLVKRSKPEQFQPEFSAEVPKSVTFTPRKKSNDVIPMDESKEFGQALARSGKIVAGEADESDASEMEEDDKEAHIVETSISSRKERQYRSKSTSGDCS